MLNVFQIERVSIKYSGGLRDECRIGVSISRDSEIECGYSRIMISSGDGVLVLSLESDRVLDSVEPIDLFFSISSADRALVLTNHRDSSYAYGRGFAYYNALATGRTPSVERPDDYPSYPPREYSVIDVMSHYKRTPCWSFPVVIDSLDKIPAYSIFLLAETSNRFFSMLALSSISTTTYIGPGERLKIVAGKSLKRISPSHIITFSIREDPYESIRETVYRASRAVGFRLRWEKREPYFLNRLGWCSWNALLTEDLNHDNVARIVSRLIERGVPVKWVLIDDGWQYESSREGVGRVLEELNSDPEKFPRGIGSLVRELKELGVERVGLWHTINIHWGGFSERVLKSLSAEAYKSRSVETYIPPPSLEKALALYSRFFKWVREQGVDFVKVDNQWSVESLYMGDIESARASRSVELALQIAAEEKGLDILNCMSMTPGNYSNFLISNIMRVSEDYIPFWKADAKLHTLFTTYNSLLFSLIAYPDYDMWMTYDPYSRIHAVARVISGGPIYITDRDPDKTDIEILRRIVSDEGEVVRPSEPGLVTRDIIFRNPYEESVLLKVAARTGECVNIALFNISREEKPIRDRVNIDILPQRLGGEEFAYYYVFSEKRGLIKRNEDLYVELRGLETEIISICPLENNLAVIGLKEYLLPQSFIDVVRLRDRVIVRVRTSGTLLYYKSGEFIERYLEKRSFLEI